MKAAVIFKGSKNAEILKDIKSSSKGGVITYTHTTGSFTSKDVESVIYLQN